MRTCTALVILWLALWCGSASGAVAFDWAIVGNPGNRGDNPPLTIPTPNPILGAVNYTYRISKLEVTNAQYTEFLNAVATTDNFGLYNVEMNSSTHGGITRIGSSGSYTYAVKAAAIGRGPGGSDYTYAEKPVVFVSLLDAISFTNWLHNGQGSGDFRDGAYFGMNPLRRPDARFFVPTLSEWYKAAYHKNDGVTGNYWRYPTSTNEMPNNNLPSADTGNSANFQAGLSTSGLTTGSFLYPLTDVGAYTHSVSAYGTFDQGGNVWEVIQNCGCIRGGSWDAFERYMSSPFAASYSDPDVEYRFLGFRVATIVPEPSALCLIAIGAIGLLARRRR